MGTLKLSPQASARYRAALPTPTPTPAPAPIVQPAPVCAPPAARSKYMRRAEAGHALAVQIAPTLFVRAAPVPLAVGMREQLRAAGVPIAKVKELLKWWCQRPAYLKALTAGAARFGVDGLACGTVSDQEAMERRNSTNQSSRLKGKGISPAATR